MAWRSRATSRLCSLVVVLAVFESTAPAAPPDLSAARELAGVDPGRARAAARAVRAAADAAGRLDLRLAADEIECRVLSDLDAEAARDVADRGIAAAGPRTGGAALLSLLRLRICRAEVLIDLGREPESSADIDAILTTSARDPALASAHALALLTRGVRRSRTDDLVRGQEDLLAACASFERLAAPRDLELCLGHLANHYKRAGDLDEALRLMLALLDSARERGARFDESIYIYGVAAIRYARHEWAEAAVAFQESIARSEADGDEAGVAYAETCLAGASLRLGRAEEALRHVERALLLLATGGDKVQIARATIVHAGALVALSRAGEAVADLASVEAMVRGDQDPVLLGEWLETESAARAALGDWRRAHEALSAWVAIERKRQDQRLSEQTARLRLEFHRERDAAALRALADRDADGQRLRRAQTLGLASFVVLLAVLLAFAATKVRQARFMSRLAHVDELTGLPNRRAVLRELEELVVKTRQRGGALSVLLIDADRFKAINDEHGHPVGDEVLRHLARTLAASLRVGDRIGRVGGEEFLVLLPGAGEKDAARIAERTCRGVAAVSAHTAVGQLVVTVSVGGASLGPPPETSARLLARADAALYRAKSGGRNRAVAVTRDPLPAAS
jgi:diguanylate cyclase (GGDEF)-like protein